MGQPNIFEIFKLINQEDIDNENLGNKTRYLTVSNAIHEAKYVKQGAVIGIGVEKTTFHDVIDRNHICLLIVVDRDKYKEVEAKHRLIDKIKKA